MQVEIKTDSAILEAIVNRSSSDTSKGVLLLHPHPLYGGDMHNDVVTSLERILHSLDITSLKFNFRGVNQPDSYMGPRGAVQDAYSAVNYMKENLGISSIGVVGYSFGGSIALALSFSDVFDFVVTLSASSQILQDACEFADIRERIVWPCLLFHGTHDLVVPIQDLYQITEEIGTQSEGLSIEEEGHFYSHSLSKVEEKFIQFLRSVWSC